MSKRALVSLISVFACIALCAPALSAPPTAASLAAALRNQGKASLEVRYTRSDGKSGSKEPEARYTRIAEAISLVDKAGGHTQWSSYDIITREQRTLVTMSNDLQQGYIGTGPSGPFVGQDMLDPVWFPLFPGPGDKASVIMLPDWVQRGTVKSVKEDIDGHPCWRVDIAQPNPGFERYTAWIDRTVGCCPRRAQMVGSPANGGLVTYDYSDYANVKKGVWFPKKRVARYTDFGQKGEFTIVTEVTNITASDIAKDAVLVKFPEGVTPNKGRTATRKAD